MKRMHKCTAILTISALLISGCSFSPKPATWYEPTLDYYKEGFESGWANEDPKLFISDEMKDTGNSFGSLLTDLDGDGLNELLIGIKDDSDETKFTDVYIYHSDLGPYRVLSGGEGYYIYLCDDNVIRMDSWYGSETEIKYMSYDSNDNAFLIIDSGSKPGKYELTDF
jgi:hypothetical protein